MIVKSKFKRNFIIIISILTILLGVLSPTMTVLASANAKFNQEVTEYIGESEEMTDVLELIKADEKANPKPSKNTMPHVMKRLFNPGEYINDVEYGVLSRHLDITKDDILVNGRYACNPNAPNNLINHNCNIPNFTTGLIQNVAYPFMSPFSNAEKTSSYSPFGFGVPDKIPGGTVPINPGNRASTYTALELFGYDLKITGYNGEWDRVVVSNEARMLSNFGVIDTITLMGTGLWNSLQGGMAALIENFSFNPLRWIQNLSNALEGALTGGLNTVIDTSDLNIVATNGWKRDGYSNTLYNVYVMTDKEVLTETAKRYFRTFIDTMRQKTELSPELQEVLALEQIPGFTFIEDWETEESIAARAAAESHNASERARASGDPSYYGSYVTVPEPVYYTEAEQLVFWGDDHAPYLARAAKQGLISADSSDYNNYADLVSEWNAAYDVYFTREFDAFGVTVTDLLEESDKAVFLENPHLDPKQQISHYACADKDGNMMRDSEGNPEYLYTANNLGAREFLNPKCTKARPPIGAGLMGSGWHIDRPVDTRHKANISDDFLGVYQRFVNIVMSISRSFNSFVAKLTNTVLGFAFSPILSELGIDVIVSELIKGFRDTIFFPMAALAASLGGILLFFQVLKNGSVWHLLGSVAITFLIFIVGTMFLLNPQATIKTVDELPSAIDNFIAEAVLVDDDGTSYCSTGTEKDGIRSAQCNVWGAMVFNPWVHLQFGTGYDNLYAKGFASDGNSEMTNTNESLVGNAEVYMGGGQTVNNWAMYQLDKTKAGTINEYDSSNKQGVGKVDKDMYRLVDLQAGPNNAAGADTRFFNTWNGVDGGNPMVSLLTTIQSIMMAIAIIGLGFMKIEASFMFSISMIFLPFMLLFALLPQGKPKLRGYIANLVSLLIRRAVIVVMLVVLLKTLNSTYAQIDSITQGALISIAICAALIIYRKELLDIITRSESGIFTATGQLSQMIGENAPRGVKQKYYTTKSKAKGIGAGLIGGAAGYNSWKSSAKKDKDNLASKIDDLNKKERTIGLDEREHKLKDQFQNEIADIEANLESNKGGIISAATDGAKQSGQLIGRSASRKIRRDGHSIDGIYRNAKEDVVKEGADSITNKDEPTSLDTYKEILSHSESNKAKTEDRDLTMEEGRLLKDPRIQREVRRLAREREELAKNNKDNKDYKALSPDINEMEKLAEKIDKKRKYNKIKGRILNPRDEKIIQQEASYRNEDNKVTTNVTDIKEEILREQELDEQKSEDLTKEGYHSKKDETTKKDETRSDKKTKDRENNEPYKQRYKDKRGGQDDEARQVEKDETIKHERKIKSDEFKHKEDFSSDEKTDVKQNTRDKKRNKKQNDKQDDKQDEENKGDDEQ